MPPVPKRIRDLWPIAVSLLLMGGFIALRDNRLIAVEKAAVILAQHDSLQSAQIEALKGGTAKTHQQLCVLTLDFRAVAQVRHEPLPVLEAQAKRCENEE